MNSTRELYECLLHMLVRARMASRLEGANLAALDVFIREVQELQVEILSRYHYSPVGRMAV